MWHFHLQMFLYIIVKKGSYERMKKESILYNRIPSVMQGSHVSRK